MAIEIAGSYFNNPDALEPLNDKWAERNIDELRAAARQLGPNSILVVTEEEFAKVKSQVSLNFKWSGVRLYVR